MFQEPIIHDSFRILPNMNLQSYSIGTKKDIMGPVVDSLSGLGG
jgi:hypothetical protein